jgi:glycyl-tRNA synthetase beta chain
VAAIAWAAVSLADKLDTVTGLYSAGERPTGSRDPFGIRRQMQGVIRILLDLPELTGLDLEIRLDGLMAQASAPFPPEEASGAPSYLSGFVADRTRFVLEQRGYPLEVIRAVTQQWDVSPLRARRIADALQEVRRSDEFQALAVLFKRVKNIAKELGPPWSIPATQVSESRELPPLDRARLHEPAERALVDQLDSVRPAVEAAVRSGDYRRAFLDIAALRPAVDRFFTDVFVMVDDLSVKTARLTLMAELRDLVLQLADISEIVPQSES